MHTQTKSNVNQGEQTKSIFSALQLPKKWRMRANRMHRALRAKNYPKKWTLNKSHFSIGVI